MVQIHGIRRASADAKYRQMTGQPVKPLILKENAKRLLRL